MGGGTNDFLWVFAYGRITHIAVTSDIAIGVAELGSKRKQYLTTTGIPPPAEGDPVGLLISALSA